MWDAANSNDRLKIDSNGKLTTVKNTDLPQASDTEDHPTETASQEPEMLANTIELLYNALKNNIQTEEEYDDMLNCLNKLNINYKSFNDPNDLPVMAKLNDIIQRIGVIRTEFRANSEIQTESQNINPDDAYAPPEELTQSDWWGWSKSVVENAASAASNAVWDTGGKLVSKGASIINTMRNDLSKTLIADNHPWKQKKYELGLQEWNHAFKTLTGNLANETLVDAPLSQAWNDLYATIENKNNSTDYRQSYYKALLQLRAIIESKEFENALKNGTDPNVLKILFLCEARYKHVELTSFCQELVDAAVATGGGSPSNVLCKEDFDAIQQACISTMGAKRGAVALDCLRGHLNFWFDPAMQQNVPFVLGKTLFKRPDDGMLKEVTFLRMGSPTIEDGISRTARINPEFRGFMHSLSLQEMSHLYISLQSDIPRSLLKGDESERNKAFKALQSEFPNFKLMILDQDSDFYKQKGDFSKLSKEEFLETFKGRLFADEKGFYFPDSWKNDPNFEKIIDDLFVQTAKVFLGNGSLEERQDFIEIFYALLSIVAIKYADVDSVNITCKDAIDRAMKTNSLVMQLIMMCNEDDLMLKPEDQKIHRDLTMAPAFMVKKQAIIHDRQKRLLQALEALKNSTTHPEIKNLLALLNLNGGFETIKKDNQNF